MNLFSPISRIALPLIALLPGLLVLSADEKTASSSEWQKLFAKDGVPEGWVVRDWADVSQAGPEGAQWEVKDGILYGASPRGTWLMNEKTYGDFQLQFEFKLGPRGNSGCALRAPMKGDPAFDGLELQMADLRYNPEAKDSELTGGLYRALAPVEQVYKPEEWNHYDITLKGSRIKVVLNGTTILDHDLSQEDQKVKRHDGSDAPALKDRPQKGHIGFQDLSRDGDRAMIRNVRIREIAD